MTLESKLEKLKDELRQELVSNILPFHMNLRDQAGWGGFIGSITNENRRFDQAPRGIVQYARLLWAYSAAYKLIPDPAYLAAAEEALRWMQTHFFDQKHGGYFWSVSYKGEPLDDKKIIYAHAFVVYGLAAYCEINESPLIRQQLYNTFDLIESKAYDEVNNGYHEAFLRSWVHDPTVNVDEADSRVAKTMNTHLHLLEAYSQLYRVMPSSHIRQRLVNLLQIMHFYIASKGRAELQLHFDNQWMPIGNTTSFGHDIEAAWLIWDAVNLLDNDEITRLYRPLVLGLSDAVMNRGFDAAGGLMNEVCEGKIVDSDRIWWVQAEALVGYFNAWQMTGDIDYLDRVETCWAFIKTVMLDKEHGEWFWGVTTGGQPLEQEKAGMWKTPYHNGRAMIELIKRINGIS